MFESDVIEKYLERVLVFKSNKEIHSDFLEIQQRNELLEELSESLGFSRHLWKLRKEQAYKAFQRFELLKNDHKFRDFAPGSYYYYLTAFIDEALALDPFNEHYMKSFLFGYYYQWQPDDRYKLRYLNLFHPDSTEFQNTCVDLKLGRQEPDYDYLADDIIKPLVNGLVFLKTELELNKGDSKSQEEKLTKIATDAGVDQRTIQEIKKEVKEQVEVAEKVFDNHWLSWSDCHKAYLAIEKAVELNPYHHEVLDTAIRFYGGFYWRLLFGFSEVREGVEDRKEFFRMVFGKTNPGWKLKYDAALRSFEKAKELELRFLEYPPIKKETKSGSRILNIERLMSSRKWRFSEEVGADEIAAFMDKEEIAYKVLRKLYTIRSGTLKIGLIAGPIVFLAIGYVAYFLFPLSLGVMFPLFGAAMATIGISHLREYLWKRKPMMVELDD